MFADISWTIRALSLIRVLVACFQNPFWPIVAGTVTCTLTPEEWAEIISIVSNSLTIWEGKNKSNTAVGNGTLDYSTLTAGSGKLVLNRF